LTYVAVNSPGGRRGAIEVRRSLAAETSFVSHTIRHAAIAGGTVVGLCGVLALGLGTLLVGRTVSRLVAQARRIGAGDLSARIGLHQKDELGQLGAEIDQMTDHLAAARQRIAAASDAQLAALEQLRHADRLATVGKLAAGVAHEIGTPLNVISGHAQLITSEHAAGTADHENASIVIEQTQRVSAIIRQLLSFARRHTPRRTPLELGPVVRDTLSLLLPLAADRRVSFSVKVGSGPLVCNVDHGQLQQAITNLVVNALQASSTDGRITVDVTRGRATPPRDHGGAEADYASIAIADNGAGIAAEILPHIFEPFFTTKDVGEGSGLGLSVTYGIVKDHDGWIEVISNAGSGSRFTVYLPIHAEGNVS
jgi:two-component system, NtrC family, sensor kinase